MFGAQSCSHKSDILVLIGLSNTAGLTWTCNLGGKGTIGYTFSTLEFQGHKPLDIVAPLKDMLFFPACLTGT